MPLYPKGIDTAFNKSSLPKICSTVSKKTSRGDRFGRRSQSRSASTRVSERPTRKSFVHDAHRLFEFSNGFQSSSTIIRDRSVRDRSVHSTSIKDDSIFVENSGLYKKEGITRSASSTVITDAIKIVEDGIGRPALKVLVVDDSAATRKIMERLLTNKGYEVNTAVDGVDCLRIVNEGIKNDEANFNLIVMDDNMPNMSGPATSKILRANNYSGIICGVTGNTTSADISNFKNHGATLVLPKPLNLTILEAALSSCDLLSLQG